MLKKLKVKNFKGFNKEIEIDFSDIKTYDFNKNCIKNNLVNKGIIYGENASGKSNIGYAIFDIISNLTDKNSNSELYRNYLNAKSNEEFATFEYSFIFDKMEVVYKYFKKSFQNILEEELLINNKRVIYYNSVSKNSIECNLQGTENLDKNIDGINISALKYIYKNSKLENNDENKAFQLMMEFVNNMLFFRCLDGNTYIGFETGIKNILENIVENGNTKKFEKFLNEEGIKCQLVERNRNGVNTIMFKIGKNEIDFYEIASTGTKSLALLFYWYQNISKTSFVYVDEFDAFYHFELSEKIVEKLKEIKSQVILTTHNTFLMSNELLRPDCYFIIFENKVFKPLFKLTNKELRYDNNLEKIYRANGFLKEYDE